MEKDNEGLTWAEVQEGIEKDTKESNKEHMKHVISEMLKLLKKKKIDGPTWHRTEEDFIWDAVLHECVLIDLLNSKDEKKVKIAKEFLIMTKMLPLRNIPGADNWYWP